MSHRFPRRIPIDRQWIDHDGTGQAATIDLLETEAIVPSAISADQTAVNVSILNRSRAFARGPCRARRARHHRRATAIT
jgi:hypothetical protein